MEFKYKMDKEYYVFKVISSRSEINNSYILDVECDENKFNLPSVETIERWILKRIEYDDIKSINDVLYTKKDKEWLNILEIERESKLNRLIR